MEIPKKIRMDDTSSLRCDEDDGGWREIPYKQHYPKTPGLLYINPRVANSNINKKQINLF